MATHNFSHNTNTDYLNLLSNVTTVNMFTAEAALIWYFMCYQFGGGGGGVLKQDLEKTNIHVAWLFIVTYNVVNISSRHVDEGCVQSNCMYLKVTYFHR